MPKFRLSISMFDKSEVAIINNLTGTFARQGLKSMKKIRKEFKHNLNSSERLCFCFMTTAKTEKLQEMLPKHRLS